MEEENDTITLEVDSHGVMYPKSQVTDYMVRGDALEEYNLIEFFMNTYKDKIMGQAELVMEEAVKEDISDKYHELSLTHGHRHHQHVPYQQIHPKWRTLQHVMRASDHNNLPNFIGRQFPCIDDPETYDFYCASMLMLLKPWHNLCSDLKGADESWSPAFEYFRSTLL